MSNVYTASDGAILTIEDAARRILELEKNYAKLLRVMRMVIEDKDMSAMVDAALHEIEVNARVDAVMDGEVDPTEGSLFSQQRKSEDFI